MNQISPDADFSDLLGKRVVQVCIGVHQAIINLEGGRFEGRRFISIEGKFSFDSYPADDSDPDFCAAASDFAALLESVIDAVEVIDSESLLFRFSNHRCLTIYDSNYGYESFEIRVASGLIVV